MPGYTETLSSGGFLAPVKGRQRGLSSRASVPVSDRDTLRGLTQFATQFGFAGSATSL